jgi:error-prone DNA polymerase
MTGYAELAAATNYSFLRGASHPHEVVAEALRLGHTGIGIADCNTVAGVVRAWVALKEARENAAEAGLGEFDFKLITGARLVFADGTRDIIAYPATRFGWGRLTRLLTLGNLRAKKGGCILHLDDLLSHVDDMLLIVMPGAADLTGVLDRLQEAARGQVWVGVKMAYGGRDKWRLHQHMTQASAARLPLIAVNDALYATPEQRRLHDILSCIREQRTIDNAGRLLAANAERHLKSAAEMTRLFADAPWAIGETQTLLGRIHFDLAQLHYEYPHEPVPPGYTSQAWLETLVLTKAAERWPEGVPDKLQKLLASEFAIIERQNYAAYFLTVHDIVAFARSEGILCQGRGSAANSAICFILGITAVDPLKNNLLFSRFISEERREPPDIDVDFEHERREEVMQYVYRRYGRHRAGIAATVIHYRPRSAVREVGKALGLTDDVTNRLSGTVWGSFSDTLERERFAESGFDPDSPEIARLGDLVGQILKFPRHLSQHVGGFVLTEDRLDETVPIHNAAMTDRTFIEWDKDDIDALGLMKVDVLALGMLTCIQKAFALIETHLGKRYTLDNVPDDAPDVFDMLCKGDSVGVFQVESRAQMNMLPRLRPREFYDLVIQVAIVRPGPIQGDMVHPYLRRRQGLEAHDFPSPTPPHDPDELSDVLGKTLGIPLFQEQAMKLAIVAAGFTPSEANRLRRAMATFRNLGTMAEFEAKLVGGMVGRGYDEAFARRCYQQIEGFGSYGFPESHALAFARLVWVSSYIKCRYPAVFAAALLNSQPMGFYAPAQIVRDAGDHGVEVLPVDVNHSAWDNGLERSGKDGFALRLGLRQINGFRAAWSTEIVANRPFASVEHLAHRAGLPQQALRLLADADACGSIGLDRRDALWEARRMPSGILPLFAAAAAGELGAEPAADLPPMSAGEQVAADYQTTRLSLKAHPMALLRPIFDREAVLTCAGTSAANDGGRAKTAGVVLVRQRPGKGNAIFVTLEDETGVTNVVIWARLFERYRRDIMAARLMLVEGGVQRSSEGVVHLVASRLVDRTAELARLSATHDATPQTTPADEDLHPDYPRTYGHPRSVRILPKSRDFH